ncbi:MAG TPA: MoxR family ATPase [Blastocatellia bacterium]|nr:MoxR family ATPase [Blastocatellia bacterium]
MNDRIDFQLYRGDGTTIAARGLRVPPFQRITSLDDPAHYLAEQGLRDAVNVALTLGQPLLVTGEPGTGKTQLAGSIAYELALPAPLRFQTKTTSNAKDLFYRYDALGHFHDAQFQKEESLVQNYITYEALGLAILLSMNPAEANSSLPAPMRDKGPIRSVVLIDEIDKAPRDLSNDVLNEIETMSFTVTETGTTFSADQSYRPILVLTSNSEKNLPDAFLRRCVFYHISFPQRERLTEIVQGRLRFNSDFTPQMVDHAIRHFEEIRELALKKKPATAEFLAWMRILEKMNIDVNNLKPGEVEALAFSYSILAKSNEDKEVLHRTFIERHDG